MREDVILGKETTEEAIRAASQELYGEVIHFKKMFGVELIFPGQWC